MFALKDKGQTQTELISFPRNWKSEIYLRFSDLRFHFEVSLLEHVVFVARRCCELIQCNLLESCCERF